MHQVRGDYQQYDLNEAGHVTWAGDRMNVKLQAMLDAGLPHDLCSGKSVLDVGCDMGFWSFLAATAGATKVLGIDRNRHVRDRGPTDLVKLNQSAADHHKLNRVRFVQMNLGRQWHELGEFQVAFCMSVYHHIFAQCGSHHSVWFWLARHVAPMGTLIWEGPTDAKDVVVQKDVPQALHGHYFLRAIQDAWHPWFELVLQGPALHEKTRELFVLRRRANAPTGSRVQAYDLQDGAAGATRAFLRDSSRRTREIEEALGVRVYPGSLNMMLPQPFDWDRDYYRCVISDSTDRKNPNAEWAPRWCRFYPMSVGNVGGWAMRFEGERYDQRFVEMIAPHRLRDLVPVREDRGPTVKIADRSIVQMPDGLWWPEGDAAHVREVLHIAVNQLTDVMPFVRDRKVAVQAGGHVGIYPIKLSKYFDEVHTFEPHPLNFECLQRNMHAAKKQPDSDIDGRITAYRQALGNTDPNATQLVRLAEHPTNSGAHRLSPNQGQQVEMISIDQLGLQACDLIVLDIEGYEGFAIQGAEQTIRKFLPIIFFEDKGESERYGVKKGALVGLLSVVYSYQVLGRSKNDVLMGPIT